MFWMYGGGFIMGDASEENYLPGPLLDTKEVGEYKGGRRPSRHKGDSRTQGGRRTSRQKEGRRTQSRKNL